MNLVLIVEQQEKRESWKILYLFGPQNFLLIFMNDCGRGSYYFRQGIISRRKNLEALFLVGEDKDYCVIWKKF